MEGEKVRYARETGGPMAAEHVTEWLQERKPDATVRYEGPDDDGVHRWTLEREGVAFELDVASEVLESAGMLAERLMQLDSLGYLSRVGEEEFVVVLTPAEVAGEPGLWE